MKEAKNITYKLWLFKKQKTDSYESFDEYYRETASESFFSAPESFQDATIETAYKTRFCTHIQ